MMLAARNRSSVVTCKERALNRLTRPKISAGWRDRAWLRGRGGSYHTLDIGAASRSLNRLDDM